jgi:predicted amidohydrolase
MQTLTITTIQADLKWEDPEANLNHFDQFLGAVSQPSDLYVLPEMFSTGFTMNPERVALHADHTIDWMRSKAAEKQAVIAGSIVVQENGQYFNRLIWMQPDGNYNYYNKAHLFGLAGEDKPYTPGQSVRIFEYKGWKICPMICYDLRFPVWSRNTQGYDLLIYVASWPVTRIDAWKTLLQARAIENQSYVIGVNRVGKDENDYTYSGDSCVVDYAGNVIYRATGVEQISTLSLDYDAQQDFRQKLPYLKDQDTFDIKRSLTKA